jgi:hypothetical protein
MAVSFVVGFTLSPFVLSIICAPMMFEKERRGERERDMRQERREEREWVKERDEG